MKSVYIYSRNWSK